MKSEDSAFWSIFSYLLSGLLLWGAMGWGLDKWLNTSYFLLAGLIIGVMVSTYLVWLRFGRD